MTTLAPKFPAPTRAANRLALPHHLALAYDLVSVLRAIDHDAPQAEPLRVAAALLARDGRSEYPSEHVYVAVGRLLDWLDRHEADAL